MHCGVVSTVCLLVAGFMCAVSTESMRRYILFAAAYLVLAGLSIMIILPVVAPRHQSTAWVFTTLQVPEGGDHGLPNKQCVVSPSPVTGAAQVLLDKAATKLMHRCEWRL